MVPMMNGALTPGPTVVNTRQHRETAWLRIQAHPAMALLPRLTQTFARFPATHRQSVKTRDTRRRSPTLPAGALYILRHGHFNHSKKTCTYDP